MLTFPKLEVALDFYIDEDCGIVGSHLNTVASPGVGKFLKFDSGTLVVIVVRPFRGCQGLCFFGSTSESRFAARRLCSLNCSF